MEGVVLLFIHLYIFGSILAKLGLFFVTTESCVYIYIPGFSPEIRAQLVRRSLWKNEYFIV